MQHSTNISEIAKALSAAQKTIQPALRDTLGQVGNVKKPYADIQSVWQACRESLTANGLSVVQAPSANGTTVTVSTLLLHSSGEWIRSDLTMIAAKPDPQSIGSAITYARRYALSAMVSVAPGDDDDGHSSSHHPEPERTRHADPPPPPPAPEPKPWQTPDAAELIAILRDRVHCEPKTADGLGVCQYAMSCTEQTVPQSMSDVWPIARTVIEAIDRTVELLQAGEAGSVDDALARLLEYGREEVASRQDIPATQGAA